MTLHSVGEPISRRGWIWAALAGLFGLTLSARAEAAPKVLVLGEVDSKVRRAERWLARELRKSLRAELARLEIPARSEEPYVLSVSLTQLFTKRVGDKTAEAESTAVISAVLRKQKGGALHAILRGKATAIDQAVPTREVELSALQGAVRSALRRVPEAIS